MKDARIKLKNGKIAFVKNGDGKILKEIKNLKGWEGKIEIEVYEKRKGVVFFTEISIAEIAKIF